MDLIKCPNCNNEFINTCDNCLYCGFSLKKSSNKDYFNIIGNSLIKYDGINKNVIIPDNVIEISNEAFKDNKYIEIVVLSSNTKIIGESAFENCTNLKLIKNNEQVQYYKKNCFRNSGLLEIEIFKDTMEIGEYAFFENCNLRMVNYHPNKNIKLKRAFAKCSHLLEVVIDKKYFYPSFGPYERGDGRPTFFEAFWNTPYMAKKREEYSKLVEKKICPDCGGRVIGIFNKKCSKCNIYYRRIIWR